MDKKHAQISHERHLHYVNAWLVVSHLDYCNSILVGVPKVTLSQLQRIQNMAAKVMLGHENLPAPMKPYLTFTGY